MRRVDFFLSLFIFLMIAVLVSACSVPGAQSPAAPTSALPAATSAPEPTPMLGSDATPTGVLQPTATHALDDLNAFGERLRLAVETRDFAAMRALMGDQFAFAVQNTSLNVVPADEAIERLKAGAFDEGSTPALRPGTDVVALLNGIDPLSVWGPVDEVLRAVHVMGLGPQAADEAVIVIGRQNGKLVWHGLLLPEKGGYFQAPGG